MHIQFQRLFHLNLKRTMANRQQQQQQQPVLKAGDKVDIIAGLYKRYGQGTYVGPYGKKMWTVEVHGDKARNVRLTSIRKANDNDEQAQRTVVLSVEEYNELQQEIAGLANALQALQIKVKGYGH
jgi:hypothetical protein